MPHPSRREEFCVGCSQSDNVDGDMGEGLRMTSRYNPFEPAQVDDHFDVLAALRQSDPITEVMPGVFYLARRDDIIAVSKDPASFVQGGFEPLTEDLRSPDQHELGETDPPFHTVVRRNLAAFFSIKKIAAFEPLVREACDKLTARFSDQSSVDLIGAFGAPLPALVIGRMSGLPEEDLPLVRAYSDDYIFAKVHAGTEEADAASARCLQFDEHLRHVIAARRESGAPPDDLLTTLIESHDDAGLPIFDERILTHLSKDVLIGGIETTTHFIGNLFFQILSEEGLYETLRQDRDLVPAVVEESLRHLAPVQVVFRKAAVDATVGGQSIPAGSVLVLGLASGSRDATVCPHAEEFDVTRGQASRRHLAFNFGIHLCVGAPLARLEGITALNAMLDRFPAMALAPEYTYQRVEFFMMRGPSRLDVVFPA
jgi:cytochrome P450